MTKVHANNAEKTAADDASIARKDALIATLSEQRWLLMDERRRLQRQVNELERRLRAHAIPFTYRFEELVSVRPDPRD